MWARILEFMLACWLAISPFIFRYPKEPLFVWINDFTCSILIAFFALICYVKSLRQMHLWNLGMAFWLYATGYFLHLPKGASQNYIVLGILLLMTAILPSESEKPPKPWRDFYP